MELGEMILAQSAAAVGVPVLLARGVPGTEASARQRDYVRRSELGLALLDGTARAGDVEPGGVLALNFHDVPAEHRAVVAEQLRRVADLGPCVLDRLAGGGAAGAEDDGGMSVLVAFYDGYREAALFGAEECERLGLQAVFLPVFDHPEPRRGELDDADLAQLARAHRLGFHTASHRSGPEIGPDELPVEVVQPLERLTAAAGRVPLLGAYRGGGRFDPGRPADRLLARSGLGWWLSNWSLEPVPPVTDPSP